MIRRRDILRAAAAGGLAFGSRDSFAQTKGTAKKKAAPEQPPVRADERVNQVLAPVRDEHRLPGLIGAILTGNKLAAIGALGIRKIGATDPIPGHRPGASGLGHQGNDGHHNRYAGR